MVSDKNIPRIHVHGKWDNNNEHNGVQIQVTNERKMTKYCINTKHIPNTSSKKRHKGSNHVVSTQNENEMTTTLNLSFEEKYFIRGRKCYNNKIVNN